MAKKICCLGSQIQEILIPFSFFLTNTKKRDLLGPFDRSLCHSSLSIYARERERESKKSKKALERV